jgi:hypothetical protein
MQSTLTGVVSIVIATAKCSRMLIIRILFFVDGSVGYVNLFPLNQKRLLCSVVAFVFDILVALRKCYFNFIFFGIVLRVETCY